MLLGNRPFTVGNQTDYSVDYSAWLEQGETLASGTAVASGVSDITVSKVSVTPSRKLLFTLQGGSLNETFTVALQVVSSRGERKNDTAIFRCVAP